MLSQQLSLVQRAAETADESFERLQKEAHRFEEQKKYNEAVFCYYQLILLKPDDVGLRSKLDNAMEIRNTLKDQEIKSSAPSDPAKNPAAKIEMKAASPSSEDKLTSAYLMKYSKLLKPKGLGISRLHLTHAATAASDGVKAMAEKAHLSAIIAFDFVLLNNPFDVDAPRFLAAVVSACSGLKKERYLASIEDMKLRLLEDPTNSSYMHTLGKLFLHANRADDAKKTFIKIIKQHIKYPMKPEYRKTILTFLLKMCGEIPKTKKNLGLLMIEASMQTRTTPIDALVTYNKVIEMDITHHRAYAGKGYVYLKQNFLDKAADEYTLACFTCEFETTPVDYPKVLEYLNFLKDIYSRTKEIHECQRIDDEITRINKLLPKSGHKLSKTPVRESTKVGKVSFSRKSNPEPESKGPPNTGNEEISCCKKKVDKKPNKFEYHIDLANTFIKFKRYHEAKGYLSEISGKYPNNEKIRTLEAKIESDMKKIIESGGWILVPVNEGDKFSIESRTEPETTDKDDKNCLSIQVSLKDHTEEKFVAEYSKKYSQNSKFFFSAEKLSTTAKSAYYGKKIALEKKTEELETGLNHLNNAITNNKDDLDSRLYRAQIILELKSLDLAIYQTAINDINYIIEKQDFDQNAHLLFIRAKCFKRINEPKRTAHDLFLVMQSDYEHSKLTPENRMEILHHIKNMGLRVDEAKEPKEILVQTAEKQIADTQYSYALITLTKAINTHDIDDHALYALRAECHRQLGNLDDAGQNYLIAWWLLRNKKPMQSHETAIIYLEKIRDIYFQRSVIFISSEVLDAVRHHKKLIEIIEEQIKNAKQLAQARIKSNSNDTLIKLKEEYIEHSNKEFADKLIQRCKQLLSDGDRVVALHCQQQACLINPGDTALYNQILQSEYGVAAIQYQTITQLFSDPVPDEKAEDLLPDLSEVLKLATEQMQPQLSAAKANLLSTGQFYNESKNYASAYNTYEELLRLEQHNDQYIKLRNDALNNKNLQDAQPWLFILNTLETRQDFCETELLFSLLINKNPNNNIYKNEQKAFFERSKEIPSHEITALNESLKVFNARAVKLLQTHKEDVSAAYELKQVKASIVGFKDAIQQHHDDETFSLNYKRKFFAKIIGDNPRIDNILEIIDDLKSIAELAYRAMQDCNAKQYETAIEKTSRILTINDQDLDTRYNRVIAIYKAVTSEEKDNFDIIRISTMALNDLHMLIAERPNVQILHYWQAALFVRINIPKNAKIAFINGIRKEDGKNENPDIATTRRTVLDILSALTPVEPTAKSEEALVNEGKKKVVQGHFEEAIKLYTQAININKTNYVLYAKRGDAYRKAGKIDEACEDYTIAVWVHNIFDSHSDLNLTTILDCYRNKRDLLALLCDYNEALKCNESLNALILTFSTKSLAEITRHKEEKESLTEVRSLLKHHKNNPQLKKQEAELVSKIAKCKESKASEMHKDIVSAFRTKEENNNTFIETLITQIEEFLAKGRSSVATTHLEFIVNYFAMFVSRQFNNRISILFKEYARKLVINGEFHEARNCFKIARKYFLGEAVERAKFGSSIADTYFEAGKKLLIAKNSDAIHYLEEALAFNKTQIIFVTLADAYIQDKRLREAKVVLQTGLQFCTTEYELINAKIQQLVKNSINAIEHASAEPSVHVPSGPILCALAPSKSDSAAESKDSAPVSSVTDDRHAITEKDAHEKPAKKSKKQLRKEAKAAARAAQPTASAQSEAPTQSAASAPPEAPEKKVSTPTFTATEATKDIETAPQPRRQTKADIIRQRRIKAEEIRAANAKKAEDAERERLKNEEDETKRKNERERDTARIYAERDKQIRLAAENAKSIMEQNVREQAAAKQKAVNKQKEEEKAQADKKADQIAAANETARIAAANEAARIAAEITQAENAARLATEKAKIARIEADEKLKSINARLIDQTRIQQQTKSPILKSSPLSTPAQVRQSLTPLPVQQDQESKTEEKGQPFTDAKAYRVITQLPSRPFQTALLTALEATGNSALAIGSSVLHGLGQKYFGKKPLQEIVFDPYQDVDFFTTASRGQVKSVLNTFGFQWTETAEGKFKVVIIDFLKTIDAQGRELKIPISRKVDICCVKDKTLLANLLKRDSTINTIVKDKYGNVYDPTGRGIPDFKNKQSDTVYDAKESFTDDPSRILRLLAQAFAHQLDLKKIRCQMKSSEHLIQTMDEKEIYRVHKWIKEKFFFPVEQFSEDYTVINRIDSFIFISEFEILETLFNPAMAEVIRNNIPWIRTEISLAHANSIPNIITLYMAFFVCYAAEQNKIASNKDELKAEQKEIANIELAFDKMKKDVFNKNPLMKDKLEGYSRFNPTYTAMSLRRDIFMTPAAVRASSASTPLFTAEDYYKSKAVPSESPFLHLPASQPMHLPASPHTPLPASVSPVSPHMPLSASAHIPSPSSPHAHLSASPHMPSPMALARSIMPANGAFSWRPSFHAPRPPVRGAAHNPQHNRSARKLSLHRDEPE